MLVAVVCTAVSQFNPLVSTSESPGSPGTPSRLWSSPLRMSASTSSTREPALAMEIARFAAVKDLPSFGTELVTRIVLGRCPASKAGARCC